jgi:predicted choloylglycine hydrolase
MHKGRYLRFKTQPKNAYGSIANSDIMVGREDGMNEKGLAIAGSEVASKTVKPGIMHTLLIRGVLDRCSNVDEAVELLTKAKHARAYNYVIADKSGKFAIVEATPEATNAKIFNEGTAVTTNHFQSKNMGEFEDASKRPSDTLSRSKRVYGLINSKKGLLDHKTALKILSDHKENVCGHTENVGFNTVWSTVFSPGEGVLTTSDGHPCNSPYKQYRI